MIDWDKVYKLTPEEFSEDPDKYADPRLIYNLGTLRRTTNRRIFPSPVPGALARFKNSHTSRHFVGEDEKNIRRKSIASDIFMEGLPIQNFSDTLSSGLFNGIGIYLDTKGPDGLPWVEFHLDIRLYGYSVDIPLIWIVEKVFNKDQNKMVDIYRYPQLYPEFWELLTDYRLYTNKTYDIGIKDR